MTTRNPKQVGTTLWDCVPQSGPCPNNCNQCFYNHGFYVESPIIPDPTEVGDGIVRMNSGNDSNNHYRLVVETAEQYKHVFFNTSRTFIDFPGPVVITANPQEELGFKSPLEYSSKYWYKIMFVRLRLSTTNVARVGQAVTIWTDMCHLPVVLTFMHYYDFPPSKVDYVWKTHVSNSSWLPTRDTMKQLLKRLDAYMNPLVTMCGSLDSNLCNNCLNCQSYYWIAKKRIEEYEKVY